MKWKGNKNCVLCGIPQTSDHIFFSYDLAKFTWVSEGCIKVGQIHKTSWTIGCNKYNLKLFVIFWELHSTQTLTTRTHIHPYEYTYANPTPMSTSEGPRDSRSHHLAPRCRRERHLPLNNDGNVTYHLMHNARKSRKKSMKRCEHQDLNPGG
jgi:hypothetical protein